MPASATAAAAAPSVARVAAVPNVILNGVSCPSATYCVAVGSYRPKSTTNNGMVPLVEVWNGTAWALQSSPVPARSLVNELDSVSCASPTSCMAVGTYSHNGGVQGGLAESWDGTAWSVLPTPKVAGEADDGFLSVSCTAAAACTAVGQAYNPTTPFVTLAEAWNGAAWTIESTPRPSGVLGSHLDAVSCTSSGSCDAVGWFLTSASVQETLAETWNGTEWTISSTPDAATSFNELEGISCSSASSCVAVGAYEPTASTGASLVEVWNGTAWTESPLGPKAVANLYGVACESSTSCVAVGDGGVSEIWDGRTWALRTAHLSPSDTEIRLAGVAGATPASYVAVGWYSKGGSVGQKTLAAGWSGTSWRVEKTPW